MCRAGNGQGSSRFSPELFSSAGRFLVSPCILLIRAFFRISSCWYTTRGMTPPFCNVALPVPLRATFTYAVPETLRGTVQPGSRVLVPFRKKAMVGVVVEMAESAPRSEEHTSELQSQSNIVCRLLLEKKKQRLFALSE